MVDILILYFAVLLISIIWRQIGKHFISFYIISKSLSIEFIIVALLLSHISIVFQSVLVY